LETCATTARREVAGAAASAGRTAPEAGARGALGLRVTEGAEGDEGVKSRSRDGKEKTTVGRFRKNLFRACHL
jgi:hypothetical protein